MSSMIDKLRSLFDGFLEQVKREAAYNPDQPRAPKGDPDGGQWVSQGGGAYRTREDGVTQVKHGDRGVRDVPDTAAAHRAIRQFDAEDAAEKELKRAQDSGDKAAIKKAIADLDDARNEKEFGSDYDPNRPKQADIAQKKAASSLAKAAEKKATTGSAEKKFKPAKDSGYAGESAARKEYESAAKGITAHYEANGWTATKPVDFKFNGGFFDAEFTKGGESVRIVGRIHKSGDDGMGRSYQSGIVKNWYSLNVSHHKPRRSAEEVRAAAEYDVTSEDSEIEFVPAGESRAAGYSSGPFRSLRAAIGKVRREMLMGEPHLVVPVRALVEGVIFAHGATTPEFVPASTFAGMTTGWNVRPVMAGHPQVDGQMVSASSPEMLDRYQIGWTFASAYDDSGRALDMEAWINERRARALGGDAADIVRRLVAEETIEVSVGTHVITDPAATGEYKGRAYRGAWRTAIPDHLAFLKKGERGACSIEMGCGALRAGEENPELRAACDGKEHTPDGTHHTDGTPCACKGASSTTDDRKDEPMQTIDETRAKALSENPRNTAGATILPFLRTLTEEQAKAWEAALPEPPKQAEEKPAPRNAEEYVNAAPADMRDFLHEGLRAAAALKNGQIAQLLALKERCPFTEEQLKAMSTAELHKLIVLSGADQKKDDKTVIDFGGRGFPRAAADSDKDKDNPYTNPPDPYAPGLKALQEAGGRR